MAIAEGAMAPAGLALIEAAKTDGETARLDARNERANRWRARR